MARFLLLLGAVVAVYFVMRWASRQPARAQWQMVTVLIALVLVVLVLTGRAHWLTAVFAAILPFVRGLMTLLLSNLPLLKRLMDSVKASKSRQPPSGGQTSTVQSQYIRMTLDHDSGDVSGEVDGVAVKGQGEINGGRPANEVVSVGLGSQEEVAGSG